MPAGQGCPPAFDTRCEFGAVLAAAPAEGPAQFFIPVTVMPWMNVR